MNPVIRAAVLAGVSIGLAWVLPPDVGLLLFAVILGGAAGVYVGFALVDGRPREKRIETWAAVTFIAIAVLGAWISPLLLALGYVLHGIWDASHHPRGLTTRVVGWWPPFCLTYDMIVAAFIVYRWWPVV
jgi:hypothetical protein